MHLLLFFLVTMLSGSQKYDLNKLKSAKRDSDNYRIWVYFEDKDHSTKKKLVTELEKEEVNQ